MRCPHAPNSDCMKSSLQGDRQALAIARIARLSPATVELNKVRGIAWDSPHQISARTNHEKHSPDFFGPWSSPISLNLSPRPVRLLFLHRRNRSSSSSSSSAAHHFLWLEHRRDNERQCPQHYGWHEARQWAEPVS